MSDMFCELLHPSSLPCNYPCVPPVFEIEANQSGSFSYRDADNLFELLMEESLKCVGQTVVFDLVSLTQDHMSGMRAKSYCIFLILLPNKATISSN